MWRTVRSFGFIDMFTHIDFARALMSLDLAKQSMAEGSYTAMSMEGSPLDIKARDYLTHVH